MNKLKVLFFAADPLSADEGRRRLDLAKEAREIRHEVVVARHRDNVEIDTRWATRTTDLRRELLEIRPDIVHFSGHGGSRGLVLDADDGMGPHHVGAAALKDFFSAFRGQIRVVVLNACHSQPQAEAIAEAVGCAIGTPSVISDQHAITFSAAFYNSIAFGESVQAAFDQACATLRMNACPDDEIPTLVVRDNVDASQLFPIPADTSAPARPVRRAKRIAWGTTALITVFAASAMIRDNLRDRVVCARPRAVQQVVMGSSATPQGVLNASATARADDPMAGPRELMQAKTLHRNGDHAAEFILLKQAAEDRNPEAMTSVGLAYLRGEGVPIQQDSAIKYLRGAAERRDPRGLNELGEAYLRGEGVDRNSDHLAKSRFELAAAKGYAEAMLNLGDLYRDGRSVDRNGEFAVDWYEKAARAGIVDAMVDAGLIYENGVTVSRNMRRAFCWYEAAAKAGSVRGMVATARVLENRREYKAARRWYQRAQAVGSADAMHRLGVLYQNGWGVRPDSQQAISWFQRAATAGSEAARDSLRALGLSGRNDDLSELDRILARG
jgi:TPR repeat protein